MGKPLSNIDLTIKLQPKERQLLEMMETGPHALIGFGGARGGGKSHTARSCAIIRRLKYRGSTALVFRKTYDDLYQNHILEIMKEMPEVYSACWNAEHKLLKLPGGGMVLFRYGDTIKDIMEMKGPGYDDVFIDEASDLEPEAIAILSALNRSTRTDLTARTVLTFNPGGPSHGHLKKLFVDKDWTAEERELHPAFIQSYAWDNLFWVKKALMEDGLTEDELSQWYDWPQKKKINYLLSRSDYGKMLKGLPPNLRDPWLYGLWESFIGQMFGYFKKSVHVVEPFAIPKWWNRWGGNDPGFNDPGVWHCFAEDQDGIVYVYREMTFDDRSATYEQQARMVHEATKDEPIEYWVTGGDAMNDAGGARSGISNETIQDHYIKGGLNGFVIGDHAKGCLARRAAVMHEMLKVAKDGFGNESAKLKIFKNCVKLIETLPSLPVDPARREQVLPCTSDHWYECAGRAIAYRHSAPVPAKPKYGQGTMGSIDGSNEREEEREQERERLEARPTRLVTRMGLKRRKL